MARSPQARGVAYPQRRSRRSATMIDKQLLEILACPATYQSLAEAPAELVARLNTAIRAGGVKNVGGEALTAPLEAGLVRKDGGLVYPIKDGIPVLLVNEGVPVPSAARS